jgi:hypothetical protein
MCYSIRYERHGSIWLKRRNSRYSRSSRCSSLGNGVSTYIFGLCMGRLYLEIEKSPPLRFVKVCNRIRVSALAFDNVVVCTVGRDFYGSARSRGRGSVHVAFAKLQSQLACMLQSWETTYIVSPSFICLLPLICQRGPMSPLRGSHRNLEIRVRG